MSNIIPILFCCYFLQALIHFFLLFYMLKENKIISGFLDLPSKNKEIHVFMFQIFFKENSYKNKPMQRLFTLNAVLAIFNLIALFFLILHS